MQLIVVRSVRAIAGVAVLFLYCSNCSISDRGSSEEFIQLPRQFVPIESTIKEVEYIALETDDAHLLGSHVDILADSSSWFLLDKGNGRLYRYSDSGLFLNEIGHRGNGPGEYVQIQDVQVIKDTVLVFAFPFKLIYYDVEGVFIKEEEIEGLGDNSIKVGNGILTYRGYRPDEKYRLSYYLRDSRKDFLFSKRHVINMSTGDPVFSMSNDSISVVDSYNNTVYVFSDGKLSPFVSFDFGKYAIPEEFYHFSDPYKGGEYLLSRDFARISRFVLNGDEWLAEIPLQSGDSVVTVYCYKSHNGIRWFKQRLGDTFFSSFKLLINNEIIALIDPSVLSCPTPQFSSDNYVVAKIRIN